MKISVEQSGGFSGQTLRLADFDTEQLDTSAAQDVEQMVRDMTARPIPVSEPLGADLLRYTISINDGGSTRSIRFSDDGSPQVSTLMELVNSLLARSNR